jgi:hypothetical protein
MTARREENVFCANKIRIVQIAFRGGWGGFHFCAGYVTIYSIELIILLLTRDMLESVHLMMMTISRIRWFVEFIHDLIILHILTIYTTSYSLNIIYIEDSRPIKTISMNRLFWQFMTISWIYRFWRDIVEFLILRLMTIDIEELVTFWPDDQHLNILLILPISSISSFFSVVARYDDIDHISVIDNVTISNICWLFCFWRYPQLILLWRYPVIREFLCDSTISHIC